MDLHSKLQYWNDYTTTTVYFITRLHMINQKNKNEKKGPLQDRFIRNQYRPLSLFLNPIFPSTTILRAIMYIYTFFKYCFVGPSVRDQLTVHKFVRTKCSDVGIWFRRTLKSSHRFRYCSCRCHGQSSLARLRYHSYGA